jgi:hypothetical protein
MFGDESILYCCDAKLMKKQTTATHFPVAHTQLEGSV